MKLRHFFRFCSVAACISFKMDSIKSVFIILIIGSVFSKDSEFSILDRRVWSPETHSERLVAESFTKGVYTVPGYSANENRDASDPPFDPSPECGDKYFNLTEGSFGTISSPNYPHNYPSSIQCEWIIESIPGTVVEATFFDVITQPWLFSFSDYVSVSNTGTWDKYRRFAGDANHKMPFTIVSKENRLAVRFVSSRFLNFRGFKLTYIVRPMKASDESPPTNEYGSAFNNDLVAVCSSRPMPSESRINTRFSQSGHYGAYAVGVEQRMEQHIRIVNGIQSLPHQYPFMVIILTNQGSFCSGSLIDPSHVLTAASCLEATNPENPGEMLQSVDLVFGTYNLSNRAENLYSRQYRSIQYPNISNNVFIHPHFEPKSGANDIAIVRVNAVKITKYVQPVFLPSVYTESNSFTGWTLRTMGWGSVDAKKLQLSPVLREAAATVIPISHCREHFSGSVTGNHICTKNPFFKPIPTTELPPTTPGENLETTVHPVDGGISSSTPETFTSTTPGENFETTSSHPVENGETSTPDSIVPSTTISIASVGILEESFRKERANEGNDDGDSNSESESEPTATIEYQSPCHGDSGSPLIAEFEENHTETENDDNDETTDPNKAGHSVHDCVNAKQNVAGNSPARQQIHNHVCQRPKDTNQKWFVQVGVLSFGSRVCGRKYPVVYTRVTAHLQWIAYITGRHG